MQKLRIGNHLRYIGCGRQNAFHMAWNPGCTVVFQNADPLIALLHIEIAHILEALDWFPDALIRHMKAAQVAPLPGKFTVQVQKR